MTIKSSGKVKPSLLRNVNPPAQSGIKSSFAELNLPNFIGQILGQYQDIMVHQVEREVRSKALAAVKEESRHLHYQALERLRSMESDVQKNAQLLLEKAREKIFEMIRDEMETIFGEMEINFQILLDGVDQGFDVAGTPGLSEDQAEEPLAKSDEIDGASEKWLQLESETEAEMSVQQEPPNQGVWLELPPPLDLKPLIEFYDGLSEMQGVRILQSVGSVDKGIAIYVRPKQPSSLTHLLQAIPSVRDVRDGTSVEKVDIGNNERTGKFRTLRISLTSKGN